MRTRPSLALLAAAALLGAAPARAQEKLVDGIAAQVGSQIVLVSEVTAISSRVEAEMRKAGLPDSEIAKMKADVLERLIESKLVEHVVEKMDLKSTDAEVDAAIRGIAQEAGLSIEQLERSVTAHGLSVAEYRGKIREEIERTKVINAMVRSKVKLDEAEVKALYAKRYSNQPSGGDELHLRHLVVTFGGENGRTRETACKMVERAQEMIGSGDLTFEQAASEVSEANPGSQGDLGWIHESELAAWMRPAVKGLEPGQVSGLVETSWGCNLLKLVDRRAFAPRTYEDVKQELTSELFRQKMEEEYGKWIEELRAQTYIERKGIFAETTRLSSRQTE
jgi:peptidyl-prolyl cis-trans isomerase SurA